MSDIDLARQLAQARDDQLVELMTKGRKVVMNGEEIYLPPSAADMRVAQERIRELTAPGGEGASNDLAELIRKVAGRDGTMPPIDTEGEDAAGGGV